MREEDSKEKIESQKLEGLGESSKEDKKVPDDYFTEEKNVSCSGDFIEISPEEIGEPPPEEEIPIECYEKEGKSKPDPEFDSLLPYIYIKEKEKPALFWLAEEIKVNPLDLMVILSLLRSGNSNLYKIRYKLKKDGTKREICIPEEFLKTIQRKINRYVVNHFRPAPNVFGFSGGNVIDAITPHLKSKIIFSVDLKDAFPTIKFIDVFNFFITGRKVNPSFDLYTPPEVVAYGYFSWYAAKILAELTTYKSKLPQGAPTSPKLFDILCGYLDKKISELAQNTNGIYTRYADNIFFSLNKEEFPQKLRQAIIKAVEGQRNFKDISRGYPHFNWHKLKVRRMDKGALRMLGLNIIDGKIYNTRSFKRKLRLSIHHLFWLLDHGRQGTPQFNDALAKIDGQMAFARIDTLPSKLYRSYLELRRRLLNDLG